MENQQIKDEIRRRLAILKIDTEDDILDDIVDNNAPLWAGEAVETPDILDAIAHTVAMGAVPYLVVPSPHPAIGMMYAILYIGKEDTESDLNEDYYCMKQDGEHYAYVYNADHPPSSDMGLVWVRVDENGNVVRYQ